LEIPVNFLIELVNEWYNRKIPLTDGFILKAAAEPKDPAMDKDHDGVIVSIGTELTTTQVTDKSLIKSMHNLDSDICRLIENEQTLSVAGSLNEPFELLGLGTDELIMII